MITTKSGHIYQIRNIENDKVYIGSTEQAPKARKKDHFGLLKRGVHSNRYLQAAFIKSPESFRYEILEWCSIKILLEREADVIAGLLRNRQINQIICYNLIVNPTRPTMANETKIKMSNSHKGIKRPAEVMEKTRLGRIGKKHSKQSKEKMSRAAFKREKFSIATRLKMSQSKKGKKFTEEHRENIRMALLGRKRPKEVCEKISASKLGHKQTTEQIEKRRLANTGKKRTAEQIVHMRLVRSCSTYRHSQETNVKISNSLKNYYRKKNANNDA